MLRVDAKDRKIGLSRKNLHGGITEEEQKSAEAAAAEAASKEKDTKDKDGKGRDKELRGGTGAGGLLISIPPTPAVAEEKK